MEEAPTGFLLVFILPFHIIGGAALGAALHRTVRDGFTLSSLGANFFLFVWGAMFGGLPLLFGLTMEIGWFFFLQSAVFLGTVAGVALYYEWLRGLYSQPGMAIASIGFVLLLVGAALTITLLTAGGGEGLLPGLIFGGIGGILTLTGVLLLWRSR